jgi:hypothetical protein
MTKLYPIGTQLITRWLSQAALAKELGFLSDDCFNLEYNTWSVIYSTWSVIVTEDNQPWLSPVPIVGDLVQYHTSEYCSDKVTNIMSIDLNDEDILWVKDDPSTDIDPEEDTISRYQITEILKRLYPNGQRAPLIEWDEVILPIDQTPNTHPAP